VFIKYAGTWEAVATGRHCILGRRADTDDLTFAHVLADSADLGLRDGEEEITEAEWLAGMEEIRAYNDALPPAPEPEPTPDPFALIADKLDDLAAEIRKDGRRDEADKMHEVAEVARAASGHRA